MEKQRLFKMTDIEKICWYGPCPTSKSGSALTDAAKCELWSKRLSRHRKTVFI